jgi:carboxymethylenebutenolidase
MYEGMLAETVRIRGHESDEISAYLARPLGAGPYPGVVVIHHMPGWDEATKEITRKFAYHGLVAICPNLHHREGPGSPDDVAAALRAAGGVPDDRCVGDVEGGAGYLRSLPYSNGKVGVIGYCSGGRQTYMVACKVPSFDAAVDCYGGRVVASADELTPLQPVAPLDMTADLGCPLLGLFGAEDSSPSPEHVAITEEELKRLGKTYEFHTYENAGHGFFGVDRPSYRQAAAVDGWQKVFAWFDRYLATAG